MFKTIILFVGVLFASQSFAQREGGVTGSGIPPRPIASYTFRSVFAPKPTQVDCYVNSLFTRVIMNGKAVQYPTVSKPFANLTEVFNASDRVANLVTEQSIAPTDAPMVKIEVMSSNHDSVKIYERAGEIDTYKKGEDAEKLKAFVEANCQR